MARVGGISSKFYRETKGLKVSGGQAVKSGTILTRQGQQWKPGLNVIGFMKLTAACDGHVYFTKRRGKRLKKETLIHVRPLEGKNTEKAPVKAKAKPEKKKEQSAE